MSFNIVAAHSKECTCRLRTIAIRDYQESVTTGQTHGQMDRQTDAGQSDPYVPLCCAGETKSVRFVHLLRPKKINIEFPLTLPKKLGSVGR